MCGILGHVDTTGDHPVDRDSFHRLLDALNHRGPDAAGELHDDRVSLGNRRLRVIDLSASANQPLSNPQGDIHITYNGEVYNHGEIRAELVRCGYQFRTTSDTEVILLAYQEWGIGCVQRFNGMFAFALYDQRRRDLYLVRDRLGVKPLYYGWSGGRFLFCSELKGIINYPGFRREVNRRAISCFLSYRYVLGSETYFQGVHQLEPGKYLLLRDGRQEIVTYWDLDVDRRLRRLGGTEREGLKQLIADAVDKRMVSDVPVALFLSGGLDSTLLLREMSRTSRQPVKAFTASFGNPAQDETRYADLAGGYYGAEVHAVSMAAHDYWDHAQTMIRFKDQPLGMHNEVAMYLLARTLKEHATVALCGEGADELFSGYGRIFRSGFDLWRLQGLALLPPGARDSALRRIGLDRRLLGKSRLEHFLLKYSYFPVVEKNALFTETMRREAGCDEHITALFRDSFRQTEHRSFHDQISHAFIKLHLPGLLLMLDATSMAASVEARTPFLDYRLVESAFALPARYKLRWKSWRHFCRALGSPAAAFSEQEDTTKWILRELYREELPREILEREKMPFPVPLSAWFTQALRPLLQRELLADTARIADVFDLGKLRRWMERAEDERRPGYGRQVWLMLSLELWLRQYT